MKAVYTHQRIWTIRLKDKTALSYSTYSVNGKYYHYGEIPDDRTEDFISHETVFYDLMRTLCVYNSEKTIFRKRVYLNIVQFSQRIYKDELLAFDIQHKYKIVDNPQINLLEHDLGFDGYSELVFDREHELMRKNFTTI